MFVERFPVIQEFVTCFFFNIFPSQSGHLLCLICRKPAGNSSIRRATLYMCEQNISLHFASSVGSKTIYFLVTTNLSLIGFQKVPYSFIIRNCSETKLSGFRPVNLAIRKSSFQFYYIIMYFISQNIAADHFKHKPAYIQHSGVDVFLISLFLAELISFGDMF